MLPAAASSPPLPRRRNGWADVGRSPGGRRLCQTCAIYHDRQAEVGPRRYLYCSKACADEWAVRNSPSFAGGKLWERDHGVCAICGLDTEQLREAVGRWRAAKEGDERRLWLHFERTRAGLGWRAPLNLYGPSGFSPHFRWWEVDHIIPVYRGGGQCDLDGLRTLCFHCHRQVSREQAGERAAARRWVKRPQLRLL